MGDKEKIVGEGWDGGGLHPSPEASRGFRTHRGWKACTSGVAVRHNGDVNPAWGIVGYG